MPETPSMSPDEVSKLEKQMDDDNNAVGPRLAFKEKDETGNYIEYASRLKKLRAAMTEKGIHVVLLSSPEVQCWLHGYQARWYRTGSTTEWAPCNFTAVHVNKDAVIKIPLKDVPSKDPGDVNHTIFSRSQKAKPINLSQEWAVEVEVGLELTDGFLVFDSSDHKDLIQFTSIAEGFCHFDDPKKPERADAGVDGVHKFLVDELKAQKWLSGPVVVGIEMWSPRQNAATTANLSDLLLVGRRDASIVDVSVMMRDLQRIKSEAELQVMREAARILDTAFYHLKSGDLHVSTRNISRSADPVERIDPPKTMRLHAGMTEIQVWAELEWAMAQEGGETAGLHNAISRTRSYCHALSSTRPIGNGPLLLDPCGIKHRYHVNTARQFYLGKEVPPELAKASKIAADAINVLHKVAEQGLPFSDVSKALRKHYQDAKIWGLRDWIGGYQLGIAFTPDWVGEFNWNVDLEEDKKIRAGLVTNFESFVGGAGFIDTVVFLEKGIEVLSTVPREIHLIDNEVPAWWVYPKQAAPVPPISPA